MTAELTIGRIVHFQGHTRCHPAIVTRVENGTEVYATVFEPLATSLTGRVKHGHEMDDWHWPGECGKK